MAIRNYSNTAQTSTLTAAIGATTTTITLANYVGDPTPPFTAAIARGTATEEIVLVTAVAGNVLTVQRGYDQTSAQAQGAGATFQEVVVALDFREANAHTNATTGVHGVTSGLVGLSDIQTLTNKTLVAPSLSSPTFTGTTTIATANVSALNVSGTTALGTATASTLTVASLSVTGAVTVTGTLTANNGITIPTGKAVTLTDQPAATTSAANKAYVDAQLVAAKSYTDTQVTGAKSYTDSQVYVPPDTGWQTLTVTSPLAAQSTGCQYRVIAGVCHFAINTTYSGTFTAGFLVTTFPTSARPSKSHDYAGTFADNSSVKVRLGTNGQMTIVTAVTSGANFTVSGSFPVG